MKVKSGYLFLFRLFVYSKGSDDLMMNQDEFEQFDMNSQSNVKQDWNSALMVHSMVTFIAHVNWDWFNLTGNWLNLACKLSDNEKREKLGNIKNNVILWKQMS